MRMVVDVDLAFTDQAAYGEFILSLPNPCSAYTFFMDPPGGYAVLSLAPDLVMAIVDRAFGGKGQALPGDGRPLTRYRTKRYRQSGNPRLQRPRSHLGAHHYNQSHRRHL